MKYAAYALMVLTLEGMLAVFVVTMCTLLVRDGCNLCPIYFSAAVPHGHANAGVLLPDMISVGALGLGV
jgi:hypothetical protein